MLIKTLAAALLLAAEVSAAPLLRCHIEHAGKTQELSFTAVSDPYAVAPVAVGSRFRFKAVMVGDGQQLAYIKLYTYYQTRRQAYLLDEVKYLAPQPQPGSDPDGLTGIHYLYSPLLGREMQYGCALLREAV